MGRGLLGHRIARQPENMDVAMASHREVGQAVPHAVMVMPLSVVTVSADATSVEEATPLVTSRGVVPATGPGRWDQLHAAGRA